MTRPEAPAAWDAMFRIGRHAAVVLVLLLLTGCGHEVTPTERYDSPGEIPAPSQLTVRPAVFGPFLAWEAPDSDFVVVEGWHVYRRRPDGDERRLTTEPVKMRQYQDLEIPQVGQTLFWVTAISRAGVESLPSTAVRFLWDDLPPQPPTGLIAQTRFDRVSLFWNRGVEFDLAGYVVYRNNIELIRVGDPAMPVAIDNDVQSGRTYRYDITSVDFSALESLPGEGIFVTVPAPPLNRFGRRDR
ncbi:MAG: hypothetical protein SGI90_00905 [Candidatus Eisenbacteria bacterium]|nr:hypothetical protein [Candidatus Eisenbacteria bacterium]